MASRESTPAVRDRSSRARSERGAGAEAERTANGSGRRHTARELMEDTRRHWPENFAVESELSVGFLRMYALVREAAQQAMAPLDLTPPEFDVLVSLRRSAPPHVLTPGELYRSLLISAGGITYVLGQLQKKGLVARETLQTDRRVKPVRLTAEGRRRVARAMKVVRGATRGVFQAGMSAGQLTGLRDQLYALLDGAERHVASQHDD